MKGGMNNLEAAFCSDPFLFPRFLHRITFGAEWSMSATSGGMSKRTGNERDTPGRNRVGQPVARAHQDTQSTRQERGARDNEQPPRFPAEGPCEKPAALLAHLRPTLPPRGCVLQENRAVGNGAALNARPRVSFLYYSFPSTTKLYAMPRGKNSRREYTRCGGEGDSFFFFNFGGWGKDSGTSSNCDSQPEGEAWENVRPATAMSTVAAKGGPCHARRLLSRHLLSRPRELRGQRNSFHAAPFILVPSPAHNDNKKSTSG